MLVDAAGQPLKMFLQRDLPDGEALRQRIEALGGRVEAKVPIQGYVVVEPGSAEDLRLRECWLKPDRPHRHFVSRAFIDACAADGPVPLQVFVGPDRRPLRVHIDPAGASAHVRAALAQRIRHGGGDPDAPLATAAVVLADPGTPAFHHHVKRFESANDRHVESYTWVARCIDLARLVFTPTVYRNPGGRKKGDERTAFTAEDDAALVSWIANRIPHKESGGRTGNRIYQELVAKRDEPGWDWVARHSWQSWRERYKKGWERLDSRIQEYVNANPHLLNQPSHYGYRRQGLGGEKKQRKKKDPSGEVTLAFSQPDPDPYPPVPTMDMPAHPYPSPSNGRRPDSAGATDDDNDDDDDDDDDGNDNDNDNDNDDNDNHGADHHRRRPQDVDSTEWNIRIGRDTPPKWGKRHLLEAADMAESYERANKRPRHTGPLPIRPMPEPATHPLDRALQHIAEEHRFTLEEVREHYDKCGDMDVTRERFARMRATLNAFD